MAERRGGALRAVGFVLGAVVLLLGVVYGGALLLTRATLPNRATIAGVPVGGRTSSDAEAMLRSRFAKAAQAPLTLRVGESTVTKTPAELGLAIDYPATVRAAGGDGSYDPRRLLEHLLGGGPHGLVLDVDRARLDGALLSLAGADRGPTDATVTYDGLRPVVTPGVEGRTLRTGPSADAVLAAYPYRTSVDLVVARYAPDITTEEARRTAATTAVTAVGAPVTLTANGKSLAVTAAELAQTLTFEPRDGVLVPRVQPTELADLLASRLPALGAADPVDATIQMGATAPTVVPSRPGVQFPADALAAAVEAAAVQGSGRAVAVQPRVVAPLVTTEQVQALGVSSIVGEFTTSFPGTSAYRYVNIPTASGLINNRLVRPGETFSMNDALGGKRTAEKGWAAGGGISEGKVVTTLGGGISQVATTLFNAVFFAGLEDVQHKPHSLYFARYPQGREATLAFPTVDLKFRNDSPYGVLIDARTTGRLGTDGTITVRLWSTRRYDVRQENTVLSNVQSAAAAPLEDPSPTCEAQVGRDGFDIAFDRVFYAAGAEVRRQPYHWTYKPAPSTFCSHPDALRAAQARTAADQAAVAAAGD